MSGATIGGVVGYAIGFYFGGPAGGQIGWMIGSAVGGYVDPTIVEGPRLKDLRGTTSSVGGVIPRAWGTAPVPCNIIWQQPGVTEVQHTDDGKGSGTEQRTYTYTRSYAVMFHLGQIDGILQIKRNGKIVYDARTDAALMDEYFNAGLDMEGALHRAKMRRAENVRFLLKCTMYMGTQDQEPDPTIESYLGVGNVPAYRGRAYMVVTDDDVTELAGAIPQYEVIVVAEGETSPITNGEYAVPGYSRFINESPPLQDPETEYSYTVELSGVGTHSATSLTAALAWADANDGMAGSPEFFVGYLPGVAGPWSLSSVPLIGHGTEESMANKRQVWLCYQWHEPEEYFDDVWIAGGVNVLTHYDGNHTKWRCDSRGYVFKFTSASTIDYLPPLAILVDDERIIPPEDFVSFNERAVPDSPGWVVDIVTGETRLINIYSGTPESGSFLALAEEALDGTEYLQRQLGPVMLVTDIRNTQDFWDEQYAKAVAAGDMPAGMTYQADGLGDETTYPRDLSLAYPAVAAETSAITPGLTTIGEIVAAVCEDSGLMPDEYDVSQLTDTLTGYVVARETDAASVIESLRHIGLFDLGEWDSKIHFVKRGGVAVGSINGDDLVERDGDAFEREMVQETELLRRVTVGYIDPGAAYAPNTQKYERRAGTVQARGEATVEVSAAMTADQAATVAKRKVLTAWGEPERERFNLPYRLAKYTPTDVLNFTGTDSEVTTVRLMKIEDDGGIREIEAANNCAEAYNATAVGVAPKPPSVTDSTLVGPTLGVYMNLPSLRTQDNVPGVTIAACGFMSGWSGASILMSADDGVSYQELTVFLSPSTMGRLTADVTDTGEPISVRMLSGSLASITDAQLALRQNGFAITTDDVSEVGQFKTATAGGSGLYDLTDNVRGALGTDSTDHAEGDSFVMVATAQFIPLDISLAGRTLYFKAVSFGTSADSAEAVPFVFNPVFTSVTVEAYTDEGGSPYTDEDGYIYYSADA